MDLEKELKQYDLKIRYSEAEDREPIDFAIEDNNDNVCWVWGSEPWKDVQVECDHPYQCIDWGDDDEMGECELCGAQCHWHWEYDYDDGYKAGDRIIHGWEKPDKIGGLVGKYLKELQKKF